MKIWLAVEVLIWFGISISLVAANALPPFIGIVVFVLGTAFFGCLNVLPFIIHRMKMQGLVGKDMNKAEKPKVAEMGGTGILFGFALGILLCVFLFSFAKRYIPFSIDLAVLFAGFSTILLMGFLGVFDDLIGWKKGIRQYQHALVPLFAALPLMAIRAGVTTMALPIVGPIDFGIFYALILIPVGITCAANAMNMLAGLNGLEAGLGALITATLLVIAIAEGQWEAAFIAAAMLGALLAFLHFNWFPAKIFPGDATTLMVGAGIGTIAIIGNMERIGVLLLVLFFVEFLLKSRTRFQGESFGQIQKDGTLKAPEKTISLTHFVMKRGKFTEKQVVQIILAMQFGVCTLVLAYWHLNRMEFFNQLTVLA